MSMLSQREEALGFALCVTSPRNDLSVASSQHAGRSQPIFPVPPCCALGTARVVVATVGAQAGEKGCPVPYSSLDFVP